MATKKKLAHADIWKEMSAIDVSEFVKSRGVGNRTLSWIPWGDCLAILQTHYPEFEYEFPPVTLYPDGSAEVECSVSIGEISRTVALPVMDHRFDAIVAGPDSSPSSRDINDGRWRAFVKCVAILTGLGFQLYRDGSAVPVPVKTKPVKRKKAPAAEQKKTTTVIREKVDEKVVKVDKGVEELSENLKTLSAMIEVAEENGGLDAKGLKLAREVADAGGPLERVNNAIDYLETELNRV